MNIAKSLKKLASNQTFVVLAAVVAVAAVYYYTQSFNTPVGAMTGQNEAAEAAEAALERPRALMISAPLFWTLGINLFLTQSWSTRSVAFSDPIRACVMSGY